MFDNVGWCWYGLGLVVALVQFLSSLVGSYVKKRVSMIVSPPPPLPLTKATERQSQRIDTSNISLKSHKAGPRGSKAPPPSYLLAGIERWTNTFTPLA